MLFAVRITYSTAVVLEALGAGHRYGFDIMDATGLPSGTVYPILRRLEEDGHVQAAWEDEAEASREQRPPRKYYALEESGHGLLANARRRFHGLERVLAPVEAEEG